MRLHLLPTAMRLHHAALIALLIAPVLATAEENLGTYEDRIAVEDVMARYVWTVDSLDADGYVAVFTEDAVIDSNGSISKGHDEIRKVVTNLIKRREETADRAEVAPCVRDRDGRPRHAEAFGDLCLAEVLHEHEPRHTPLADGEVREHLAQDRGQSFQESIGAGLPGRDVHQVAVRLGHRELFARQEERRP